jgi:transcriptional regulator GlxA family with amidase domain
MSRQIAVVIFPGFQILDAAGPIAAFEIAGSMGGDAYQVHVLAAEAGLVKSSAGAVMAAVSLDKGLYDTVMVAGGDGTRDFDGLAPLIAWLKQQAATARRTTSVCSGALLLAEAGLLEGRRATTHWTCTELLARRHPGILLEPDRIFVRDEMIWTSAGITAGIDLALALIEEDLGQEVARRTARQLVVHHRRGGGQSQHSELIDLGGLNGRFGKLLDWARERLGENLGVERLAEQAVMSSRHFARAFANEMGVTPAKAIERLRLEAARVRIETSREPVDRVAETTGFGDSERMRRAFLRAFGQPPQALRRAAQG